jgi:two-component system sensor histidine kinase RegB
MHDAARINFLWLLRLRWGAIVGQVVTILGVQFAFEIPLPLKPLFAIIGIEVASNAACALWAARDRPIGPQLVGGIMGCDVVLLTALLSAHSSCCRRGRS